METYLTSLSWLIYVELTLLLSSPYSLSNCLSPFLSGPQMFSITSSWCWGFVLCYKGEPGRQLQFLHPRPSPLSMTNSHLLCCQKEQTEDRIVGKQGTALCQICVPVIFVNFSDCFSSVPHFLLWLPVALRFCCPSPEASGGGSFSHSQVETAADSFESYSNFKRLAHPTKCSWASWGECRA